MIDTHMNDRETQLIRDSLFCQQPHPAMENVWPVQDLVDTLLLELSPCPEMLTFRDKIKGEYQGNSSMSFQYYSWFFRLWKQANRHRQAEINKKIPTCSAFKKREGDRAQHISIWVKSFLCLSWLERVKNQYYEILKIARFSCHSQEITRQR